MYDPQRGLGDYVPLPERIVTSRCHEVLVHSLDLYMHFGALDPQLLYPTKLVVCVIFLVAGWEH